MNPKKPLLTAAMALALIALLIGCKVSVKVEPEAKGPDEEPEPVLQPVTGINVICGEYAVDESREFLIDIDEELAFTVTLEPAGVEGATVSWTGGSADVSLSVAAGGRSARAKGLSGGGSLDITVSASNKDNEAPVTRTFKIKVKEPGQPYPVTGISVKHGGTAIEAGTEIFLGVGEEAALSVTLEPVGVADATVTWPAGNESVSLLLSPNRLSAKAKGLISGGSLTITVSAANEDNQNTPVTFTFKITVKDQEGPELAPVTGITLKYGTAIIGENGEIPIQVNEQAALTVTLEPVGVAGATVTWTAGNTGVLLSVAAGGLSATAKGLTAGGYLAITISAENSDNKGVPVRRTFTVRVEEPLPAAVTGILINGSRIGNGATLYLAQNQDTNLNVTLEPAGTSGSVTWQPAAGNSNIQFSGSGLSATARGLSASGYLTLTVSASNAGNKGVPVTKVFTLAVGSAPTPPNPGPVPNKHLLRSAWISTVDNLDIGTVSSESAFRTAVTTRLDVMLGYNMNAVIFQVSPMLDAFWDSKHRPWSRFLMGGSQGSGPSWDPLAILVEESHKRGMEFHAWFNPYRVMTGIPSGTTDTQADNMTNTQLMNAYASSSSNTRKLAAGNFAVKNPAYIYRFREGTTFRVYLDAGRPEVREHVAAVVEEVCQKYDIDAIHFDDYFYPYDCPGASTLNMDSVSFALYGATDGYGNDGLERERWRRENNNKMVEEVKAAITKANNEKGKSIQFGISPFGIWANRSSTMPEGSATSGNQSYRPSVYADTRKWVLDETLDYLMPQLYWQRTTTAARYDVLAPWWSDVHEGKNVHLYIGHGVYNVASPWNNSGEILAQLKFNEDYPNIKGSAFFRYGNLTTTTGVLGTSNTSVKTEWNKFKTLIPPKPWLNPAAPAAPNPTQNNGSITWTAVAGARYYVVYRVPSGPAVNADDVIVDPRNIVARLWNSGTSFTDTAANPLTYTYFVTALNAAHVESEAGVARKN